MTPNDDDDVMMFVFFNYVSSVLNAVQEMLWPRVKFSSSFLAGLSDVNWRGKKKSLWTELMFVCLFFLNVLYIATHFFQIK